MLVRYHSSSFAYAFGGIVAASSEIMNEGASDLMNVNEFCHCESRELACTMRSCRKQHKC